MSVVKRIKEYLDFKGITNQKFEIEVGYSNGAFGTQLKNNKTIGSDKLEKILTVYNDLNPEWLITGKGEKIRSYRQLNSNLVNESPSFYGINLPKKDIGIPLIPIEAMAGYGNGSIQVMEYETEHFMVPTFKGADYLIGVRGSSMYPKYNSGDIVACKHLAIDTFFQWNKVYVLDTVQGALIKRICKGSDDSHVLIVSDNEKYDSFELHRSEIHAIAIVMGVIRLE